MVRITALAALVVAAIFFTPTAAASPQPGCAIDENGNCIGTNCDLWDAYCVSADDGHFETYVESGGDSYGYDMYGDGGWCRWIAIRDYWQSYVFHSTTAVGVLQAYVCRRNGVVTRFDQVSTFADDRIPWPWSMAYRLDWNIQKVPTAPTNLPLMDTSTGSVLKLQVCAWFTPVCSRPQYPRYEIDASGWNVTCYVNGVQFPDCVGHRYR